jgi:hypothetical protein
MFILLVFISVPAIFLKTRSIFLSAVMVECPTNPAVLYSYVMRRILRRLPSWTLCSMVRRTSTSLMMKITSPSETLVPMYQITRRLIPEDRAYNNS